MMNRDIRLCPVQTAWIRYEKSASRISRVIHRKKKRGMEDNNGNKER